MQGKVAGSSSVTQEFIRHAESHLQVRPPAPDAQAAESGKILLIISIISIMPITTIILIILIIPNCRADKHRQQNSTFSFHRLPGVC